MKQHLEQLRRGLDSWQTIILTTHVSPDCDGLGSELAFAAFLRKRGKTVSIINCSETPEPYRFLDPQGSIQQYDPSRHDRLIAETNAIIVLDTNQPGRLATMAAPVLASKADKVVIDHHLDAEPFANLLLIDDSSAATGEIVYKILEELGGVPVDRNSAEALYIAVMTDTGSFRFPKTDADLHRMIAALIEQGADPVQAYQNVYEQDSPDRVRLLGKALNGLATAHGGAVAYITVSATMFKETSTSEPDVERFAPYPLRLKGVKIGFMFTELPGMIKISFRSKGDIPINKLAQEFGGNGHKNAAGARIPGGSLPEVIEKVVERAGHYLPK
ncbi:MAG: bifunctional oligoribonuclease/PAP phosphatase NrnA [Bacteroidota bacterium]